ncbi:MAG: GNAT family N-acetyltransferase [Bdellovibrionota bacterium]
MRKVRRAKIEDAHAIHEIHMRSIRELCSKDHSPEEIQAWGNRPFRESERVDSIENQYVWVVENDNRIEGFGHLKIMNHKQEVIGYLAGLYFAPEATKQGFATEIVEEMILEAKKQAAVRVILESSLTAHKFYLKHGFKDCGPQTSIPIAGVPVQCFKMELKLT